MTYVISDPHGNDGKFFKLLEIIDLKEDDLLVIVGDVADRGPGSIKIFKHIMKSKNIMMIMGNHEAFMLDYYKNHGCLLNMKHPWMKYGGLDTYNEIMADENPEKTFEMVINFIDNLPVLFSKMVRDKIFMFCHSEVHIENGNISSVQNKHNILWGDITFYRPIKLIDDVFLVTGHIRTDNLNIDKSFDIFFEESWILMDGGCGFEGGQLNCLRLDDMKIFVVK